MLFLSRVMMTVTFRVARVDEQGTKRLVVFFDINQKREQISVRADIIFRAYLLEVLPRCVEQLRLHLLEQLLRLGVVGIKRRAVEVGALAKLPYGNFSHRALFAQKIHQSVFEQNF